jgi:hypothetical protein
VLALSLALSAATSFATDASAKGQKVLVAGFTGAKKQKLREEVIKALKDAGYDVIDDSKLTNSSKPKDIAKRAKAKGATAVVTGDGSLKQKGWKLTLVVRSASDGSVVEEEELSASVLPKLLTRIGSDTATKLEDPIEKAGDGAEPAPTKESEKPVAEDEPKAEPEKKPEKDEGEAKPEDTEPAASKDEPTGARPSPLDLGAGLRVFRRDLRYEQDVNQNLRKYALPLGPAIFVRATWYPAAHFTSGFASNIGVTGAYEQSFAASSELDSGSSASYSTTLRAWHAGVRVRVPFATHELGIGLRYGAHSFEVDGDRDPNAAAAGGTAVSRDYVPDVSYHYVRPGVDLRLGFGPLTLGAAAGLRFVTGAGAITSDAWFPDASVLAVDADLFGGYSVAKDVSVLVGVGLQRYGLNMHSKVADLSQGRDVAGGAIDQYLSLFTGIEWRPGSSRPSAEAARARPLLVGQR